MMAIIVIAIVSGALIIGALWGIYGKLSKRTEGFLVALSGGALLVSALLELIHPALKNNSISLTLISITAGAITFTLLDNLVKEQWGSKSGGGVIGGHYFRWYS